MLKRILSGLAHGFCVSIAITLIIQMIVMSITKQVPVLPEFEERIGSPVLAFGMQLILIGCMSAITSAGTAIFELHKIGLVVQSFIFLMIMLAAWIPVACIAWGFHKYIVSMIVTICSIVVSYVISWFIQYKLCRRDIDEINGILREEK